jgi:hypothetical protein
MRPLRQRHTAGCEQRAVRSLRATGAAVKAVSAYLEGLQVP